MEWTQAAREFDGGSFRISYEWKEMLTYWEANQGFVFDCAWGVDPGNVYVPSALSWDSVVPNWLVGRRAEVIERLAKYSGHIVKDASFEYKRSEKWRNRAR